MRLAPLIIGLASGVAVVAVRTPTHNPIDAVKNVADGSAFGANIRQDAIVDLGIGAAAAVVAWLVVSRFLR